MTNGDIRRSPVTRQNGLISTVTPDRNTLYALFQAGRSAYPDRPCFGYRPVLAVSAEATETRGATTPAAPPAGTSPAAPPKPAVGDFVWMTYTEVQAKVDALSSGMVDLSLVTPLDDGNRMFGIFSKNRWEWVATELSGYRIGAANVPLYDTLGAAACPGAQPQWALHFPSRASPQEKTQRPLSSTRPASAPCFARASRRPSSLRSRRTRRSAWPPSPTSSRQAASCVGASTGTPHFAPTPLRWGSLKMCPRMTWQPPRARASRCYPWDTCERAADATKSLPVPHWVPFYPTAGHRRGQGGASPGHAPTPPGPRFYLLHVC